MHRYFIIHKPYYMLSQFVGGAKGLRMLGELDYTFPPGIHAVGRLDYHSEGLLILTTNTRVTKLLFESDLRHPRTYLMQVYKPVSEETLQELRTGVSIRIKGGGMYVATPEDVIITNRPPGLPFGAHELRSDIPQSWLKMTLTEGKFRQVRKMCTAVRHPCMRLIRLSIGDLVLDGMEAGAVLELEETAFFDKLHIRNWE